MSLNLTIDDIQSYDWQVKIETTPGKTNEILNTFDAIKQSIEIILSTPKGSVPHNPEFGTDIWKYIDSPTNKTLVNLIREGIKSITRWETRIDLISLKADINIDQIIYKIVFKIKETEIEKQIEVII